MSIFKNKKKQEILNLKEQLTTQQLSDAKPRFRAMINCIREYGIIDNEIIDALKNNACKRVLKDSTLFRF